MEITVKSVLDWAKTKKVSDTYTFWDTHNCFFARYLKEVHGVEFPIVALTRYQCAQSYDEPYTGERPAPAWGKIPANISSAIVQSLMSGKLTFGDMVERLEKV